MGVLNITPDSFSDGGRYLRHDAAYEHALEMVRDGADIIDIGGESTRPGSLPVPAAEEIARAVPVIEALHRDSDIPISVDTSKLEVAQAAVEAGASMVNDITALRGSPEMAAFCAGSGVSLCLVHMRGTPEDMQDGPVYDDVVSEVKSFLEQRLEYAMGQGVSQGQVVLDPGIGFGKTVEHNLELLARVGELKSLGCQVMIGTSRKSFLGAMTDRDVEGRLAATLATTVLAFAGGVDIFRVHDIVANLDALKVAQAVLKTGPLTGKEEVARV